MELLTGSRVRKFILPAAVLAVVAIIATASMAADPEKAKEFFNQGVTAQKDGKTAVAIFNCARASSYCFCLN